MSLFWNRDASLASTLTALGFPLRGVTSSTPTRVTSETALRHSAVWACLRLRADLISTTPLDVFRRVNGVQVEVTKPPLLVSPGGSSMALEEWLYSTQFDLDRFGNAFGVVVLRDGMGFPQRIQPVSAVDVSVVVVDGEIDHYRIGSTEYDPRDIWHERQFTVAGMHVGLSPIAYAAWSIGTYLSAQEFALDWFASGAAPSGHLRNTLVPTVPSNEADNIKASFKNAVKNREILVTGRDWEYNMSAVPANTTMFLDEMQYGVLDVCRFFGVPGDLIDAQTSTGSVTYANVTQRNLQLLIMNLQPAYVRREKALSSALPQARYVKFNTDATVLRMDPQTRTQDITARVQARILSPSEAREIDNRPPFDEAQFAEFDRLFGNPNPPPPAPGVKQLDQPVINVDARAFLEPHIDARTSVEPTTVTVAPAEVHNTYEIDARTSIDDGAVRVDARSEVAPPPVTVNVEAAPPAEPILTRKRVETDEKGRIVAVIEERA